MLCCVAFVFVFSVGKAGRDSSRAGGETKILTIHPSIRCDVGSHANSTSSFFTKIVPIPYVFLRILICWFSKFDSICGGWCTF